jgi:hypothetical protein
MKSHEIKDFLTPRRQDAKFGDIFLSLRLCVFAGNIPILFSGGAA